MASLVTSDAYALTGMEGRIGSVDVVKQRRTDRGTGRNANRFGSPIRWQVRRGCHGTPGMRCRRANGESTVAFVLAPVRVPLSPRACRRPCCPTTPGRRPARPTRASRVAVRWSSRKHRWSIRCIGTGRITTRGLVVHGGLNLFGAVVGESIDHQPSQLRTVDQVTRAFTRSA